MIFMRNPIQKRLEKFESWQSVAFMTCLCERMLPNFQLFCQMIEQPAHAKLYQNILNLVWESLTVKGAKINFDNQLEKLEAVIPNVNQYDFYGVVPALDACEALSELLHALIAGEYVERSLKISQNSLQTVISYVEMQQDRSLNEQELKAADEIQQELDVQWAIYRELNQCEERDIELLFSLKNALRDGAVSNIGIEIGAEM